MTFGLKVAGWLDELLREVGRLEEMKPRVLVAQLFGGVGTMAGFGDEGPILLERFARRLGLGVPEIGWHVSRDRVVEYVTTIAMVQRHARSDRERAANALAPGARRAGAGLAPREGGQQHNAPTNATPRSVSR
jgi:hypothetical protein